MATVCNMEEFKTENLPIKEARNGKVEPLLGIKIMSQEEA